jgi:type I restriction enzyme S subunit
MSFPRYPKYKDSGVEWLGEVPEHWPCIPLWTCFRRVKRIGFEGEELLSVYRDYGVVPKSSRDDNFNKPSDDLSVYQLVIPGDLVINKMKAWQGSVAISDHRGIVSPAYFTYEACHKANSRYLHYLMRSLRYVTGYLTVSKGIRVNQWDLEPQHHSRMPLLIPPSAEQAAIATFLDRETAKIDALIAEQQRLIELLQEKRQAVISHAVTKGLNPDVPMKDSGVEWLGEVPEHWQVTRLKRLAAVRNGSTPSRERPDYWEGGDFPWLNSSVVNTSPVAAADQFVTPCALRECHLPIVQPPAVLVGMTGQGKTRGMSAILLYEATVSQHLAILQPQAGVNASFLKRVLDMAYPYLRRDSEEAGSTKGAITCEALGNFAVAIPSPEEQHHIAIHLSEHSDRVSGLTKAAEIAMDLLQERRSALISAAVTGQIDVRGLAGSEAA